MQEVRSAMIALTEQLMLLSCLTCISRILLRLVSHSIILLLLVRMLLLWLFTADQWYVERSISFRRLTTVVIDKRDCSCVV